MSKNKKNKGITLLVMIITIIILLILAGISIAMIRNSNLLDKTKIAKEKYENKSDEEQEILSNYTNIIENYNVVDSSRDTVTISKEEFENLKNANNYSTNEIKIGNWINGKPIYRYVITINYINTPQQTWYELADVSKLNIDKLIKYNISSNEGDSGTVVKDVGALKVKDNKILYYSQVGWTTIDTIIIEYTKTSDIATK